MTPREWQERVPREFAELAATGILQACEMDFFRKDGGRVPVLIGAAAFDGHPNQGVAYILDLTSLKQAETEARENEQRYRQVQAELAHVNRVATMGQLTASIAHEVNQPLAAILINAGTALHSLAAKSRICGWCRKRPGELPGMPSGREISSVACGRWCRNPGSTSRGWMSEKP